MLEPPAQLFGQPVDAVVIELDEVAGRIADVELDDVARQLDQVVAEGVVVEGAPPLGCPDQVTVNPSAVAVVAGAGSGVSAA